MESQGAELHHGLVSAPVSTDLATPPVGRVDGRVQKSRCCGRQALQFVFTGVSYRSVVCGGLVAEDGVAVAVHGLQALTGDVQPFLELGKPGVQAIGWPVERVAEAVEADGPTDGAQQRADAASVVETVAVSGLARRSSETPRASASTMASRRSISMPWMRSYSSTCSYCRPVRWARSFWGAQLAAALGDQAAVEQGLSRRSTCTSHDIGVRPWCGASRSRRSALKRATLLSAACMAITGMRSLPSRVVNAGSLASAPCLARRMRCAKESSAEAERDRRSKILMSDGPELRLATEEVFDVELAHLGGGQVECKGESASAGEAR